MNASNSLFFFPALNGKGTVKMDIPVGRSFEPTVIYNLIKSKQLKDIQVSTDVILTFFLRDKYLNVILV